MSKTSRLNPWWTVFGSMVALTVSNAPLLNIPFGLFMKPIGSEFGWSRGSMSIALSTMILVGGLSAPVIGVLVDRWGGRRVLLSSIILTALVTLLMSRMPNSLPLFIALYAVTGLTCSAQAPIGYVKGISSLFDARRGLALGLTMVGVGLGVSFVPQLEQRMIQAWGWRGAYVGTAGLLVLIGLPSVYFFLRPAAPERVETNMSGTVPVLTGFTVREALTGSIRFWCLAAAIFLLAVAINGILPHLVPLLTDKGISPAVASTLFLATGLSSMSGRVISGFLVDRLFAPYVAFVFFLMPVGGIYLLMHGTYLVPAMILLGLAGGAEIELVGFLTSRYFGLKQFGAIYGYIYAAFALGTAAGPLIMGLMFDRFHTYDVTLTAFCVVSPIAALLVVSLGKYRFPALPHIRQGAGVATSPRVKASGLVS